MVRPPPNHACFRAGARRASIGHGRRGKPGRSRCAGRRHRARHHAGGADGRAGADRSELAIVASISRPTASGHLGKLVDARLLAVTSKRRFRYYRIASPLVAKMLESIKAVAAIEVPPRHQPRSAHDDALRFARTCYDHLAGTARRRHRRRAGGQALRGAERRGRRGDRSRRTVLDAIRRELTPTPTAAACSAGPASTGASAAITSRVSSARKSAAAARTKAGWSARARQPRAVADAIGTPRAAHGLWRRTRRTAPIDTPDRRLQ